MTGIDSSAKMLELARQRLGASEALHLADLGSPLPFPGGAFDDVIASLVLHYLEDLMAPLAELRRVLTPGGRLIASVDHPFSSQMQAGPGVDYFATRKWSFEWTFGGHTALMSFWHRPLHAMTDAFTTAGFRISVIGEPRPAPAARELFPAELEARPGFLCFLFLRPGGRLTAARCGRLPRQIVGRLAPPDVMAAGASCGDGRVVADGDVAGARADGDPGSLPACGRPAWTPWRPTWMAHVYLAHAAVPAVANKVPANPESPSLAVTAGGPVPARDAGRAEQPPGVSATRRPGTP